MKTSLTHPLRIDALQPAPGSGLIGLTFCPGKKQRSAMSGVWDRDLSIDLDAIRDWNASAVVSLIEDHEFTALKVEELGQEVRCRHMDWYHLPIRDASVPDDRFDQIWLQAGAELRHRLRCGFNVLIHCKGGLGRAGTVAARLLTELSVHPIEATRRVREARQNAIETREQERYVLGIKPFAEPVPDTSAEAIQDRAAGALLGLAVGDAVGTTLEFTARDSYPPLTDMVGKGPFGLAPGGWTDDTSMALALADSLLERPDFDETDLMRRFVTWWRNGEYSHTGRCFDIGGTTSAALRRFEQTGNPVAGSTDPHTAGNGSLMRLAPVAIRFHRDRDKLRDVAARQSRTTHAASEAVDACVAWAELLSDAIEGRPLSEILTAPFAGFDSRIGEILAGSWRGLPRAKVQASGYVAHSLEAALWSLGRSGSFTQTILAAANLGEDADTTAAIAGQLAGAAYGVNSIPTKWLNRLAWEPRIRTAAISLFSS